MAAVALVVLSLVVQVYGLSWRAVPVGAAWAMLSGALFLLLFLLLSLFATSQRVSNLLSMMVMMPLMMIGGAFFPFAMMPGWMAAVGAWTPNGWALVRLNAILAGRAEPAALALASLPMLLAGAVLFALALRRLRGGFALG
jgi:ABC-2 type transport system permease protein